MPSSPTNPTVVSLSAMAALCKLSRSRFYQLIEEGIMPPPAYDMHTRRPLYPQELQQICLQVRNTNIGINGRYILFYGDSTLSVSTHQRRVSRRNTATNGSLAALKDGLIALGLNNLSDQKIKDTVKTAYPNGTTGVNEGEVLRTLFRALRRQNAAQPLSNS